MKGNILSYEFINQVLDKLHEDGNYRFELLITSILWNGYKVNEINNITKRILFKDLKDCELVYNIPQIIRFLERCSDYIETVFPDMDNKLFPLTSRYYNQELEKIRIKYIDTNFTKTFSLESIRRTCMYNIYNKRLIFYKDTPLQAVRFVKKLMGHKNISATYSYLQLEKPKYK